MISLPIALLGLVVQGQPALAWDTVPNSEKKVTIELPLATLTDVTAAIYKQTDMRTQVTGLPEMKLTVLVKDMRARDLLEEIADVLEIKLDTADQRVWITNSPKASSNREGYLRLEELLLCREANARLDALVAAMPTVFDPSSQDDNWATKKIRTPAGYAAAIAREVTQSRAPQFERLDPLPMNMVRTPFETFGYAFKVPPNPLVAAKGHRSLDAFSQRFEGTQVLIRYRPVSGTWAVKGISGDDPGILDDDPKLLRYPKPPKGLEKHPFAKDLAAWTKDDPDSKIGDEKVSRDNDGGEPLFPGKGLFLGDHLAWLHANSKANIVATAFRVPSGLKNAALPGRTVSECLSFLTQKTDCFVSISKRCVRIRHGGYWRLAACEPSEAVLRVIESAAKQRDLTLDDYGQFAAKLLRAMLERFEIPDGFLANFDLRPLERGADFLHDYGVLSVQQRKLLWQGGAVLCREGSTEQQAAVHGCMRDASIVGRYSEVLEYATDAKGYLTTSGMNDKYWENSRFRLPANYMKLIFPKDDPSRNVGIFLTPNDQDGVVFWFKG